MWTVVPRSASLPPRSFASRSLLTSPAPQTDTLSWRMTTTYSVKAGLERDGDCHSSSSSCCCEFGSSKLDSLFAIILYDDPHPTSSALQGGHSSSLSRRGGCIFYLHALSTSERKCGGTGCSLGPGGPRHPAWGQSDSQFNFIPINHIQKQSFSKWFLVSFHPLIVIWSQFSCPSTSLFPHPCPNHAHIQVVDLRSLTHSFRNTFHFAPDLHLGQMVVPHLAANFGPIYMCKMRRLT